MRKLAAALAVTVAVVFTPAVARAQGQGPDNASVAVNPHDGADVFRLAFSIDHVMRESVSPTNAAVAYSSCNSCRTTAIAIQVVLLMNGQEDAIPGNFAIATNELCDSCTTVALAYQIVLNVDGPVHLSAAGAKRVAEIMNEIRALGDDASLSPEELAAKTDALVDELAQVLADELKATGPPTVRKQTSVNQTPSPSFVAPTEPPSPTSAPSGTTSGGVDASPTPSPSEVPTATP